MNEELGGVSEIRKEECLQHYPLTVDSLPGTWSLVSLSEIALDVNPGFASGKHRSDGDGVPHLRPMNVDREGKIDLTVVKSIAATNGVELVAGDILFNNTNSPELIGKTAVISGREDGFAFSNHMTRLRLEDGISTSFIARQLHFLWMSGYMKHRCTSHVNQASISSKTLANTIPIFFPSSAEQTRIVEKLEELLSDLDAGVAELKAAQKKLAQYRQALLKAAVEGALTAEWRAKRHESDHGSTSSPRTDSPCISVHPELVEGRTVSPIHPSTGSGRTGKTAQTEKSETGAQLLARILAERRQRWEEKQLAKFKEQGKTPPKGWQDKYSEPVKPDTTNLPTLPAGWVWATLDCLIEEGPQNGLYLPADKYGRGNAILRIDDFQIGWVRLRSELNIVDSDVDTTATYSLSTGDIVVNRVNSMTHLGKSLVIPDDLDGVLFESNMMRMRMSRSVDTGYVGFYLGADIGRKRLNLNAKWAVNQASINQQDVKRTPIPFPPLDEQNTIASVIAVQLNAAKSQEEAIKYSLKQSAAQRKNILKSAFSGQLVPQDPTDEPASVLLERIRAERTARESSNKKRGGRKKREGV